MRAFATRLGGILAAAILFAYVAPAAFAQGVVFGPGLESTLNTLAPGQSLTVVVTFDGTGPVDAGRLAAVRALGVTKGVTFHALPVIGVVATVAQVYDLARLPGVRSIWPNHALTYYNHDARQLTGVERVRTDPAMRTAQGTPYSGEGVGVVINDSGIDGTLPDLRFGENLVENVLGTTNLNAVDTMLPVTYTEGVVNTDLGSGHGTHCAGTVGGTGASSDGLHAGVAPGADLIGYGSGAVIFVLDGIGGFDYAITHQFDPDHAPIRVHSNSWGSSGAFDPNDPINVASYAAYQRGITVVFAAGNEGPGENTHNPYAQAPWVISVGAGRKDATLEDFSSRGVEGESGTFEVDGREWTYVNAPTIVAPGVDIVSARATTGVLPLLAAEADVTALGANAAFYTIMSGTSMATPHVAGIVALLLEANPSLQPADVKRILQETATNMPGREAWEVGAGYVNAYAAVERALALRTDFGRTVNALRAFNSNATVAPAGSQDFTVDFNPLLEVADYTFDVPAGLAQVKATADVQGEAGVALNTVALVLTGPNGEQVGSGLTLPLLGGTRATVSFENPAPGTWRLTVRGIGSVSGVAVDPLGVTNGIGLPETVSGTLQFFRNGGHTGLSDVSDAHPAAAAIRVAVSERLVDGLSDGKFRPDAVLTRGQLAQYLVMGGGVRQHLPVSGNTFADVPADVLPFVEAAVARGAALKDAAQTSAGVMYASGSFNPNGAVTRATLAYALVQSLGLQAFAEGFDGVVTAPYENGAVAVTDAAQIPAGLKGYVYAALHLGLLNARFTLTQGPFDLKPKVTATFGLSLPVTRAEYAVAALRFFDAWNAGSVSVPTSGGESSARTASAGGPTTFDPGGAAQVASTAESTEAPATFELGQNYPNPFNPSTEIRFALPEGAPVRLAVYDLLGRQVRLLVDGSLEAGAHSVRFEAGDLASGTYLYQLVTPAQTITKQMILMK